MGARNTCLLAGTGGTSFAQKFVLKCSGVIRLNRAPRKKPGLLKGVNRHSLKAQGIDRQATQHLAAKAAAMTRNACRLRKAEANREIILTSRHVTEIERRLQHVKRNHAHRVSNKQSARPQIRADEKSNLAATSNPHPFDSQRKIYGLVNAGGIDALTAKGRVRGEDAG